jgi:foldase protein PrsA
MNEEHNQKTENNDTPVESIEQVTSEVVEETNATDDKEKTEVPEQGEETAVEEEKTEGATEETAPVSAESAVSTETAGTVTPLVKIKKFIQGRKYTIAAIGLVAVALLGLLYIMEEQGRIKTGLFDGAAQIVATRTTVANVNEGKVSRYDLDVSMAQISSGAALQGADITDPEIQAEIQTQALDMLVNTELLKQEAAARGVVVTEDEVTARYEQLKTDVGGEEVLAQRMAEFGINEKTLFRDINNELTIQALLQQVFEQNKVEVSEAEVKEFYDAAGGEAAGLPKLEEVKDQIVQQIKAGKEQEIVTSFVTELRSAASIEILI